MHADDPAIVDRAWRDDYMDGAWKPEPIRCDACSARATCQCLECRIGPDRFCPSCCIAHAVAS